VLKPGGMIFLESDNKWRPDMVWCLGSILAGDPLRYHEKLDNVLRYFKRPLHEGYEYVFPLAFDEGKVRMLNLRTFTYSEIRDELLKRGCHIHSEYGIHSITNIIPSPLMLKDKPGKITGGAFNALKAFEDRLYWRWPFSRLGMSLIVIAKKNE
jgi:hypothetical protein